MEKDKELLELQILLIQDYFKKIAGYPISITESECNALLNETNEDEEKAAQILYARIQSQENLEKKQINNKIIGMENVIRQAIKKFKLDNLLQSGITTKKIYTNLDGTLKESGSNVLSKDRESRFRGWHGIDKNMPIYAIFYQTIVKEGDFFTATRTYHFSCCVLESGVSFAGIIQTDAWGKEEDGHLFISWSEIEEIGYTSNINLDIENNNPNAYFVPNDPAFAVVNIVNCLVFHSVEDSTYINIPNVYFTYTGVGITETVKPFLDEVLQGYGKLYEKNEEWYNELSNELKTLVENKEYQKLIDRVEEVKESIFTEVFYYYKICGLLELNYQYEAFKLFDLFKLELERIKDKESDEYKRFLSWYLITEAEVYKVKGDSYASAYSYDKLANMYKDDSTQNREALTFCETEKEKSYNNFINDFNKVDYQDRKIITVSKTESLFKSNHLTLLNMGNLPKIHFPITHPKIDHTYVCHPYKTDSYLPIENYDYELLNDRINEYCYLLQCLGATSITIENSRGESKDTQTHSNTKWEGEASLRVNSVKFNSENDKRAGDLSKSTLKIGRNQSFNPTKKPFVPENLVWLANEIGWQRLIEQRMSGNILEHSEFMSSTQSQVLTNSEISDINAELNLLFTSIKGGRRKENEQKIETNSEVEWKINVVFKPMEAFDEVVVVPVEEKKQIKEISQNSLSDEEQQYLEEVKFMLEDDGLIDDKERIGLDEMYKMLKISSERAKELEEKAIAQIHTFTETELKYIEEIKFMLEDDGVIDVQEQQMLEEMRKTLNISVERAKQLENIVINRGDLSKEEKEYLEKFKTFTIDVVVTERERRILNRLANLLGISEERAIELEKRSS
ncbi:hypothetical protein CGC58_02650 [Capnocytophaga stomatis]|uniref:Uncharacterized protein n=1 Tax=Capnocytophaga stomatis TaxID=1848904 RepID=A0A250FXB5_9FLAO|nr:hypothetical protein [Capnocytophaga stomatis]ATA88728.1 hypothetical protein CGC58_02650 [Capnocytophaga stomatis]